jgi:hypothetical protein
VIYFSYLFSNIYNKYIFEYFRLKNYNLMGIGDWGLGIGDWGLGPIPNPQSPIPNPPIPIFINN